MRGKNTGGDKSDGGQKLGIGCAAEREKLPKESGDLQMLTRVRPPAEKGEKTGWNLAVMHIGAPCCGMNAAVRSFTRNCIYSGNNPIGIHNGVDGLIKGEVN